MPICFIFDDFEAVLTNKLAGTRYCAVAVMATTVAICCDVAYAALRLRSRSASSTQNCVALLLFSCWPADLSDRDERTVLVLRRYLLRAAMQITFSGPLHLS